MISQLIYNILVMSVVSSALIILFVSLRKIIIQYIGARWNYYLWFTVFIPCFAIWLPWSSPVTSPSITTTIQPLGMHIASAYTPFHLSLLSKMAVSVWLAGIAFCILYILFKHFQFTLVLKHKSRSMTARESEATKQILMPAQHSYVSRIRFSTAIQSPILCHLVKSRIYLPDHFFQNYTQTEQKYVLQHELVHLKRRDLLANAAMLVLGCLNWFNPIMYFAYRHFRNAQELSCDAVVSEKLSASEKKEYGYALLKTVINQSTPLPAMNCGWNTQTQLKERCQMLKFHGLKPMKVILGMGLFAATLCTAIAAPILEKHEFKNASSEIQFSANKMQTTLDGKGNMLNGRVQLSIDGNRIKIYADNVFVKYADNESNEVAEFIIYGKGLLEEGNHSLQFVNGTFNPTTDELSSEQIKRLN